MNTKDKIISLSTLRQESGAGRRALVCGTFDPLLRSHAERLQQLAERHGPLAVLVVAPATEEMLSGEARVRLVAALSSVAVAAVGTFQEAEEMLTTWQAGAVFDERTADRQRSDELLAYICARHSA